jgi:CHAT domain-containing protein
LQALARSSHCILLSYWLAPKQSYAWVITPAKIELFRLPPEKEIRTLVESYRTAIEDLRDPIESHHPAGEKLSQILLGPIRELVPAGSRVTIVPDGALHSLNFETLPGVKDPSKYWIEDVIVSVAPSLGLLLNSHLANRPQNSLLAIGDPEPAGQEYPRLPNARKEVETIAALFTPNNKLVYQGRESNPSAYDHASPARFSLVHFAAHATANRASPLDSALILSREGNKYTLTARDIMKVPLDADLVTLSSCRSAGARAYSGEGLVGLTWAFLQAGARRVIAGLWDVNDESTSTLMASLYGDLARGVAAEDALRAAKLSLVHAGYPYRKPYYWGPFQLYTGTEK